MYQLLWTFKYLCVNIKTIFLRFSNIFMGGGGRWMAYILLLYHIYT